MRDIRKEILKTIENKVFMAVIKADGQGILAGTQKSRIELEQLGLNYEFLLEDGAEVEAGDFICKIKGFPEELTKAEEIIIGKMAKASGVATATKKAVDLSEGKCTVIAGAWKKMPKEIKSMIQESVKIGGASTRLIEDPFIYLDKNYVRMFGGLDKALNAVKGISFCKKVIQLKKDTGTIYEEVNVAIKNGADIIMVDTGDVEDLVEAKEAIKKCKSDKPIELGFASELQIDRIPEYIELGSRYLCIGKQIIDAPLLDMKLDVLTD